MFWQGNAKLSTHMKVHSQSNGSHMPESSDALFFVAWGETDLASAPFGGVGEAGGRVARTPATGYCTTELWLQLLRSLCETNEPGRAETEESVKQVKARQCTQLLLAPGPEKGVVGGYNFHSVAHT